MHTLWSGLLLLSASSVLARREKVEVIASSNGSYVVNVGSKPWLESGPLSFHMDGKVYTTNDGSLKFQQKKASNEKDALGIYSKERLDFTAGMNNLSIAFKAYTDVPLILFEQTFSSGASNTSIGDVNGVLSMFPSFLLDGGEVDLGYLAYGGIMVGDTNKRMGRWNSKLFDIESGLNSGPIAIFEKEEKNAIFMAPFNNFMVASAYHNQQQGSYSWGVMGTVDNIPKEFSLDVALYYSPNGIRHAIQGWGKVMRTYYNKDTSYRDSDLTLNYLSYWTDNGAYYVQYYEKDNLVQNMTYEESMLKVKQYSEEQKLPYKSIQYSVWFQQGKGGGAALWEANPKLFPNGMKYMFEKTQLPATAHNRWWTSDTPYAKQNGGKYEWIVEDAFSLPVDQQFWIDFFESSRQMGFTTLMQDWLNTQFGNMKATISSVDLGRKWLLQMGEGARQAGLTIQYCMAMSRHILQSLEIPVVNQARASGDYAPGKEAQFQIGISSMLAHAVGIAPFKDTFWTTTNQPGNYYNNTEPFAERQTIVATLSTGPVGPGDMVDGTDTMMLMRCCRADGLILKPSLPAFAVDDQIKQSAFGGDVGPNGELWSTYTEISTLRFGIVFGAEIKSFYNLTPEKAGFKHKLWMPSMVYNSTITVPQSFSKDHPLVISTEACTDHCLYYTTPVLTFMGKELLLLGELNKYTPMSAQRFTGIIQSDRDVTISLRIAPDETVPFTYVYNNMYMSISCQWMGQENMVVSIDNRTCMPN